MPHILLDPHTHQRLRYLPQPSSEPHFVPLITAEFMAAAAVCPIVLTKDASTGAFYPGALLGLTPQQGALQGPAARGGFMPLHLQREGFFVAGSSIAVDLECARFSEADGEPLFDSQQQPAVCLRRIQNLLGQLQAGQRHTAAWLHALLELHLIETMDIEFDLGGAGPLELQGLYCVSQDALQALQDEQALSLWRTGAMALVYAMQVSLGRLPVLGQLAHARQGRHTRHVRTC